MKKQSVLQLKTAARKILVRFCLLTVLLINFIPFALQAQGKNGSPTAVAIRYIGTINHQPVFQVEFDNESSSVLQISISDEDGETLYSERFSDKKFSRKFKMEDGSPEKIKLVFTLADGKQSQSFEINTNLRMVQDVVVTKL